MNLEYKPTQRLDTNKPCRVIKLHIPAMFIGYTESPYLQPKSFLEFEINGKQYTTTLRGHIMFGELVGADLENYQPENTMNPKPFDINKPYQQRNGLPARIVGTMKGGKLSVIYTLADGTEDCDSSGQDGRFFQKEPHATLPDTDYQVESQYDLVNVPVKRKVECWINVYKNGINLRFDTREEADENVDGFENFRIACLHINQEFTEGEGLDAQK